MLPGQATPAWDPSHGTCDPSRRPNLVSESPGSPSHRRRRTSLFRKPSIKHDEPLHEYCWWSVLGGLDEAVAACLRPMGTVLHFLHLFLGNQLASRLPLAPGKRLLFKRAKRIVSERAKVVGSGCLVLLVLGPVLQLFFHVTAPLNITPSQYTHHSKLYITPLTPCGGSRCS